MKTLLRIKSVMGVVVVMLFFVAIAILITQNMSSLMVSEAEDAHHRQYGESRLLAFAKSNAACSAHELVDGLVASVDAFVGKAEQFDDMTVLCIA